MNFTSPAPQHSNGSPELCRQASTKRGPVGGGAKQDLERQAGREEGFRR